MQGALDSPPIVIRGQRWRGIVLAIGAGVLALGALWATLAGVPADASIWAAIAFFGAGAAIGVWIAASPSRLVIGPEGVTQTVLWRTRTWRWNEVVDFRLATIGLGTRTVGFSLTSARPGGETMRQLNTALAGSQAVLGAGWEIKAEPLAELLNAARERWVDGASPLSAVAASGPAGVAAAGQASVSAPSNATRSSSTASSSAAGAKVLKGLAAARLNRRVYWIGIGAVVAIVTVFDFLPGTRFAALVGMIIALRLYAARLHDLGRSGWWTAGFLGVLIAGCLITGAASGWSEGVVLLTSAAIQLVWIGLLGALPGGTGANRFGPAPGQPTPAAAAESFR